jgi:hypothetical protein
MRPLGGHTPHTTNPDPEEQRQVIRQHKRIGLHSPTHELNTFLVEHLHVWIHCVRLKLVSIDGRAKKNPWLQKNLSLKRRIATKQDMSEVVIDKRLAFALRNFSDIRRVVI